MKNIILIALLFISCITLGQKKQTVDTVYIKTSALCGDCKDRIETALNFEKGVKFAELNLETKVATCVYKPTKVTLAQLRLALVRAGYDADEMKADPEAVKLLPKCCQPGGH
jgi:copper chaperone CopZ